MYRHTYTYVDILLCYLIDGLKSYNNSTLWYLEP